MRAAGLYLLALLAALPVQAAPSPTVPAGWTQQLQGSVRLLQPQNLRPGEIYTVTVFPPQPLGRQSIEAWTKTMVDKGLAQYGKVTTQGPVKQQSSFWTSSSVVTAKGQSLGVVFLSFPAAAGQVQLVTILSSASPEVSRRYLEATSSLLASLARPGPTAPPSAPPAASAAEPDDRFKWVTAPGKGVQMASIEGIWHHGEGVYTYAGYKFQESWVLVLKDGWLYHGLRVPPADLNVAASRKNEPGQWRRWKRQGQAILEQDPKSGVWKAIPGSKVVPARTGERLKLTVEAHYNYAPGGGGFGGFTSTTTLVFRPDGQFEKSRFGLGGTGVVQASGGTVILGSSAQGKDGCASSSSFSSRSPSGGAGVGGGTFSQDNCGADFQGTYTLDGYTAEFRYRSGQVERKLFFFWNSKKKDLLVGDVTYSPPSD